MKRRRQVSGEWDHEQQLVVSRSKRKRESYTDPWDIPIELYSKTELCHKFYEALRGFKDNENHSLCEFMVRLPNRRSVPEYYKVVSHPIDLLKIQLKLKTDEYSTVPLFISDIRLLIDNAKLFYKPPSTEFKRTAALEKEFLKVLLIICTSEVDLKSPLSPKTVSLKLSSLSKTPATASKSIVTRSTPTSTGNKKMTSAVKTTRSKAWLDEFNSSNDPIKTYFADIFSYHDNTGEYIAQPFIDLPLQKDYPEYYHIITEPIGLANIKSQIELGHYHNLREIQEDLLLMIKNAQYFNEPHSDIYKMASILRKVIINRCIELERRYKTVEKTTKLKSPSPVGQKHSTTDTDVSESEDESSDSDVAMETEDGGNKKLLLRIKRKSLHSTKDPLAKLLKVKSAPALNKVLIALYRTLTRATDDDDGRVMSELFMKRPSAKLYPEYYIVIITPIDFKEINSKIKKDVYKSLSQLMDDVELLVNNAITFNEEYSQIHTDALALRAISHTAIEQLQMKWPHHFTASDRKVKPLLSGISTTCITTLFAVVRNCIDSTGRKLWLSLQEPPPPPREGEGYSSGKRPIGLATVAEKTDSNTYSSIHDLFADLCCLFNCYCESVSSHSPLFKDAISLHKISVVKYNELTNEHRVTHCYPNAPEAVKKLLKELMNVLLETRGADGTSLSVVLQHVVVSEQCTDDTKSKRVFSLDKVHQWVTLGRYTRLDQLQRDILSIFKQARQLEGEGESDTTKAVITFEKHYVNIRDELCSHVLWSPAYEERTIKHIEDEEREEEKEQEGGVEMRTSSHSTIIPSVNERTPQEYFKLGEVTYFPGDFIYLPPQEQSLPPQIALIESLWTDSHDNQWFDGCWFFRPHETFHIASRKFYDREVFKSDFYSSAQLNTALGKCYVLFIKEYTKFYPQGFSEENVYVCESRYMHRSKIIKRIKFWNVQENVCVKLLPRLTQCSLNRVPSVFAIEGIKSELSDQDTLSLESVDKHAVDKPPVAMDTTVEEDSSDLINSSEGSLEMSFFRELKEVKTAVTNPEENCNYYEQYCIDDKVFKLGDYVCVRSDQDLPFIARIDRVWTDSNDDPWFRGPWFLRVKEVQHLPTHMFYERELFMSNILDSNPMRSIMRKCIVLYPSDYVKWRPTEISETDVFLCDSKYNEDEKQIKKMKSLKYNDVSSSVLKDEKYILLEELFLWKCHSPQLFPAVPTPLPVVPPPPPPVSICTTPSPAVSQTPPLIAVSTAGGQVTLSLQQLQSLLTSPLVNQAKLVQQLTPHVDPVLAYPCAWDNCQESFEDISDLGSHIIRSNHLCSESDGSYYCHWTHCPRKREHGGKPFDSLQKITRHVKEVHLLRVHPLVKPHQFHPIVKDQPLPSSLSSPVPLITPANIITTTRTSCPSFLQPASLETVAPEPSRITPQNNSQPPPVTISIDTTSHLQTVTQTPPSVFVAPPTNQKQIFHSKLYLNYIERMRKNASIITPTPPTRPLPMSIEPHKVSQWIDPKAIPEGMSPNDALSALYHHMIRDAVNISNWLDTNQ